MVEIYGVEFNVGGKTYFFDRNKKEVEIGEYVIVETEKGTQIAKVVTEIKKVSKEKYKGLKKVIRVADEEDKKQDKSNQKDAEEALKRATKIAKRQDLKMNFIGANYTFDRNQLFLTFVADARVDFRSLAKELASIYKTRIELRQLGIRDKAKEVSGIGQCGRTLCCASFLNNIDSVGIGMVKNQNLSINPNKINGQCGRLLCCLNYEDDLYTEARKDLPQLGNIVKTDKGDAKVIYVDILNKKYTAITENNEKVEVVVKPKKEFRKHKKSFKSK